MPWRRKWQPTSVFLPGKFRHGQRSLVGYSPWDHKESDMTEWLTLHFQGNKPKWGEDLENKSLKLGLYSYFNLQLLNSVISISRERITMVLCDKLLFKVSWQISSQLELSVWKRERKKSCMWQPKSDISDICFLTALFFGKAFPERSCGE